MVHSAGESGLGASAGFEIWPSAATAKAAKAEKWTRRIMMLFKWLGGSVAIAIPKPSQRRAWLSDWLGREGQLDGLHPEVYR